MRTADLCVSRPEFEPSADFEQLRWFPLPHEAAEPAS